MPLPETALTKDAPLPQKLFAFTEAKAVLSLLLHTQASTTASGSQCEVRFLLGDNV